MKNAFVKTTLSAFLLLASLQATAGGNDVGNATQGGIVCGRNDGLGGGGLSRLKLSPTAKQNTYELTLTTATMTGQNPKTISLGDDLECTFSKIDPVVAVCNGAYRNPTTHLANYLKITRVTSTSVDNTPFRDETIQAYSLIISAPKLSDKTMQSLVWNGADQATLNLDNKSFRMSFEIDTVNKLSGCKAL